MILNAHTAWIGMRAQTWPLQQTLGFPVLVKFFCYLALHFIPFFGNNLE